MGETKGRNTLVSLLFVLNIILLFIYVYNVFISNLPPPHFLLFNFPTIQFPLPFPEGPFLSKTFQAKLVFVIEIHEFKHC